MERTLPVADTGFVVALLNRSNRMHDLVKRVYGQHQQIFLPQTVLAEVAYLVVRNAGTATRS
jgi:predicted nucleic acid-binding protein